MATWANTTFCTTSDVRIRAPRIDALINNSSETIGDDVIAKKITLAKDLMRQDVLEWAARIYEQGLQGWLDRAQALVDERNEQRLNEYSQLGRDPNEIDLIVDGQFSSAGRRVLPQTFVNYGTPTNGTSGTQATFAENGARLADTKYSLLYINRGTLASPTWERLTPEQCIDYITNPTELKHASVAKTLQLIYEERLNRFAADYGQNLEHFAGMLNLFKAEYCESRDRAFKILAIDLSNDGTVDEFERNKTRKTKYFA